MVLGPARREAVSKPPPHKSAAPAASVPNYLRSTRSQSSRLATPRESAGRRTPPVAEGVAAELSSQTMDAAGAPRHESSSTSELSSKRGSSAPTRQSAPSAVHELREILATAAATQPATARQDTVSPGPGFASPVAEQKPEADQVSPLIKFTPDNEGAELVQESPHVRSSRGRFSLLGAMLAGSSVIHRNHLKESSSVSGSGRIQSKCAVSPLSSGWRASLKSYLK